MKKIIFAATITGALFMANFANAQKETAAPQKKEPVKKEKAVAKPTERPAVKAAPEKTAKADATKKETGKPADKKGEPKAAKTAKPAPEKK